MLQKAFQQKKGALLRHPFPGLTNILTRKPEGKIEFARIVFIYSLDQHSPLLLLQHLPDIILAFYLFMVDAGNDKSLGD